MTLEEFSELFDVQYNNITSNQAPGLNEYEKSVFLTKAQDEIVKNYFTANSKGNNIQQGFDDSAKRQADFSVLMSTSSCDGGSLSGGSSVTIRKYTCVSGGVTKTLYGNSISFTYNGMPYDVPVGDYEVDWMEDEGSGPKCIIVSDGGYDVPVMITGFPFEGLGTVAITEEEDTFISDKIDPRSHLFTFPTDTFIVINETLTATKDSKSKYLQIIPLRYDEYTRLMSKPFKRPLKHQAWRLINSGSFADGNYIKCVEVVAAPEYDRGASLTYTIRYIRRPAPIIVGSIDDLSINGYIYSGDSTGNNKAPDHCELDPILHEDILQRAVELAKISWTATGQDNAQMVLQAGQRSE